jgi:hypothetical protein
MSNERLNGLAIMSIEREIAVAINLDEFVNAFAVNHCNRKILFI